MIVGNVVGYTDLPWILPSTGELQTTVDGYPLYLRAYLVEKLDGDRVWLYRPLRPNPFVKPAPHWN